MFLVIVWQKGRHLCISPIHISVRYNAAEYIHIHKHRAMRLRFRWTEKYQWETLKYSRRLCWRNEKCQCTSINGYIFALIKTPVFMMFLRKQTLSDETNSLRLPSFRVGVSECRRFTVAIRFIPLTIISI